MKTTKTKYCVHTGRGAVTTNNKLLADRLASTTGKDVIILKDYKGE